MNAIDINKFLLSMADWVNPEKTVDSIKAGNGEKEIESILVTWISSSEAIQYAIENSFDMLITHEPTYWDHFDTLNADRYKATYNKQKMIEDSGLVILRCHDMWDRKPDIGIPWAWARYLKLEGKPVIGNRGYQLRFDIEPVTLGELADRIILRTSEIGEPCIQVSSDLDRIVSKIGIGTGCVCDIPIFMEMGCDVSVISDDGTMYWKDIQYACDVGHPFIRVNHGTSEEPGMISLTQYLRENLQGIKVEHLPHKPPYRIVNGNSFR